MVMKYFEIAFYLFIYLKANVASQNLDSTTPRNKSQPNPERKTLNVLQSKK